MKIVIIDKENDSRKLLRTGLIDSCEEVEVIGEANNVKSGIKLLQRLQADIIFLGVEMPDGNCFDILNAFDYINLNVILVTSSHNYAIKAIKYGALDYLLKPLDLKELQLAICKLKKKRMGEPGKIRVLNTDYKNRLVPLKRIVLPGRENHIIVDIHSIVRIEASGSYAKIYIEDHKSHLVVNTLNYYEGILPSNNFFRIHKSHLINIHKIKHITSRSGKVLLKDGSELNIAARRKSAFSQMIRQLGTA